MKGKADNTDINTISVIRYQYDIVYPISIRYRLSAINTISAVDRNRPAILLHIGPILGQLCKNEIRPILKSDIGPILK